MDKKPKKYRKYVPPPVPDVSPEEAKRLEESLRSQIDSASYLQEEKDGLKERVPWLYALLFPKRRKKPQTKP